MKVVLVTVGPVRVSGAPFRDSCTFTLNKDTSDSSIAGFSSTCSTRIKAISDSVNLLRVLYRINDGVGTMQVSVLIVIAD